MIRWSVPRPTYSPIADSNIFLLSELATVEEICELRVRLLLCYDGACAVSPPIALCPCPWTRPVE
jgi:hypothetical protein